MKSVDLISGIGGTLGLWLGLSFLSLGTFIIETACSAKSLFSPSSAPHTRQCSPLSLVEVYRGMALIGRDVQSVVGDSFFMPLRTSKELAMTHLVFGCSRFLG